MAEDFCRRVFPVIDELVLLRLAQRAHVLDLCCGSGQMARALVERGFSVTGVDASEEMLSYAHENSPAATFIHADARQFPAAETYDAAISTFNSLAHFDTVTDLAAVFTSVRRVLRSDAPLLFDLSMEEAYTTKWRGSFALLGDDHACIVRPSYDSNTHLGTNHITVFALETRNAKRETAVCYHRSELTITQKCHTESDLRTALHQAGFDTVRTFDAERDLNMPGENGRMFFLCF